MKYYISVAGQRTGPIEEKELINHNITPDTLVWCEGMEQWQAAGSLPALAHIFAGTTSANHTTPPLPPAARQTAPPALPIETRPKNDDKNNQPMPKYKPDNHMTWAIVVTTLGLVCCTFLPSVFGIIAISKATKSTQLWKAGNASGSQAMADEAKRWNNLGFIFFGISFFLMIVIGFIGGYRYYH